MITGASGQLGQAFRAASGERRGRGLEWIFADRAVLDIADGDAVKAFFDRHRPDAVVNCAAVTDVDGAENDPGTAFSVNRDAAGFLAAAAAKTGAVMVHISTDFVFDGIAGRPYAEGDEPSPVNVYGESKLAGERAVAASGVCGAIVRVSRLYSPFARNFVKNILDRAARQTEIEVVADQISCPTAADGLVAAVMDMANRWLHGGGLEIYHYCDRGGVGRADFAAEIIRLAGLDCRVVPVSADRFPAAAKRPEYTVLDTGKIERDLGIVLRPWREALAKCIDQIHNGAGNEISRSVADAADNARK